MAHHGAALWDRRARLALPCGLNLYGQQGGTGDVMTNGDSKAGFRRPMPLREAMRQARVELAARSDVLVDLKDAELARLEMLNEALEPIFADIPPEIELFDRGLSNGDPPRLWVDMIAHVEMGRDKRTYRLLHDTRFGRQVLAETAEIDTVTAAVTAYIARRLVERERALAGDTEPSARKRPTHDCGRRRRRTTIAVFAIGMAFGVAAGAAGLLLVAAFCGPP